MLTFTESKKEVHASYIAPADRLKRLRPSSEVLKMVDLQSVPISFSTIKLVTKIGK
ncbi:hypothetical protein KIN20_025283 [Parelaphostrongylus tenuis]|uniref:Uncharacterized protein n=1 Tax=Parelaphostrongylus tenuis TaxID=148309 RepID=A0AAD5N940_PARTN|nr:hypothetical protein KIN20_025283 [Parelaphostrongylus tenuis]